MVTSFEEIEQLIIDAKELSLQHDLIVLSWVYPDLCVTAFNLLKKVLYHTTFDAAIAIRNRQPNQDHTQFESYEVYEVSDLYEMIGHIDDQTTKDAFYQLYLHLKTTMLFMKEKRQLHVDKTEKVVVN